jgi:S-adenosylmethionine synthetase
VLACERLINSAEFKERYPELGEDVKVMGYRRDRQLALTVAVAFVDRFVPDSSTYFARKVEIAEAVHRELAQKLQSLDELTIAMNTLDDPSRGEAGMYLSVLGTSAEGGDCGQVGRGNRVNGVISLNRPMGAEAAAGKNPVSHVGKIYSVFANQLADEIHRSVPGTAEVYVQLGSQIGAPIDQPAMASVQLSLAEGCALEEVRIAVEKIVSNALSSIGTFCDRLAQGEWPVC